MLLLIDLDNTLIDRTAAFRGWATSRFGESEVEWLASADRDGYEPREPLAARIAGRYHLDAGDVLAELRAGMVEWVVLEAEVAAALRAASAAGHVPWVVSNGRVAQQEAKLRHTGLDRLVAGWTISEGAGVRKPDRRIFELAAAAAGRPLDRTGWMVGDNSELDVGGGSAAGLRTAWIARDREWPAHLPYQPEIAAENAAPALLELIGLPAPEAHG